MQPLPFETFVARHIEFSVTCSGRDDHGTGLDDLVSLKMQRKRRASAIDVRGSTGNREMGAKLLRLNLRAPCESLTGYSGGKAEIILDLGAGSRLAAGSYAFDHRRVETFGGGIDRGCEACGAGAENSNFIDMRWVDFLGKA